VQTSTTDVPVGVPLLDVDELVDWPPLLLLAVPPVHAPVPAFVHVQPFAQPLISHAPLPWHVNVQPP
jgi:hypothetical protein